jgi:hypothetical protein
VLKEQRMSTSGDHWYVKLSDGDVHRVTLDQLDEAFQAGHIDGETMVLASGATQWTKLGALAGIDDAEEVEPIESAAPVRAAPSSAASELAQALDPAPNATQDPRPASAAAQMPRGEVGVPNVAPAYPVPQAAVAPLQIAQLPFGASSPPAVDAAAAAASRRIATSQTPQPGPNAPGVFSQYPVAGPPTNGQPFVYGQPSGPGGLLANGAALGFAAQGPSSPILTSLRPLSVDFGEIDADMAKLRGGSAKRWFGALVALAIVGSLAAVAVQRPRWAQPYLARVGLRGGTREAAAGVAPPAPPPVAEATPAPAVAPPSATAEATAPTPVTGPLPDSPLSPHFTDQLTVVDHKAHVEDSDKAKSKKHKAHGAAPAAAHGSSATKSKSTTFTTGGSKFDPLNSSI